MKNRDQKYLDEQLERYEQQTSMTNAEQHALHRWVRSGHSVYKAPSSNYHPDGGMPEKDFLDVYREELEISMLLEGKTDKEKGAWLRETLGYEEPDVSTEPTVEALQHQVRDKDRELFYLWNFVEREGLRKEANEYVEGNINTPIPFE